MQPQSTQTLRQAGVATGGERGFTLVELLVVVAIIGLLASMAVPALRAALLKSRRNAALSDLRVLRDELHKYASDTGTYPNWGAVDSRTLSPLTPAYIRSARGVLKSLQGGQLDYYLSWNLFDEVYTPSKLTNPTGFTVRGTLAYDPTVILYVTDGSMYYSQNGKLVAVGAN